MKTYAIMVLMHIYDGWRAWDNIGLSIEKINEATDWLTQAGYLDDECHITDNGHKIVLELINYI